MVPRDVILSLLERLSVGGSDGWSLQGLGMFRLYLQDSREWRLHVWDDRFCNPKGTRIHDHPWSFESHILLGSITNLLYKRVPLSDGSGIERAPTHHQQTIRCGEGGCEVGESEDCALALMSQTTWHQGDLYSQSPYEIHDTKYERGTVTLVRRTFNKDTEHARVYVPYGQKWVSNEPRPATPEELSIALGYALVKSVDRINSFIEWLREDIARMEKLKNFWYLT